MPQNRRPANVLIFFTDQQRWDTVGVYGSPMGLTPNLDSMAREGTQFLNAFTNQPICAPARACLLTGQHGTSHGVWRNGIGLQPGIATLARCLKDAGYQTAYIGKWHLSPGKLGPGPVPPEYRGGFTDFWEASNVLEHTSHPYEGVMYDSDGNEVPFSGLYRVDALTDRVIRYLNEIRQEPFLLMVSYVEPHQQNDWERMVAPDRYAERYSNPFVPHDLRPFPGDWQKELPDYYGMIARLDECLGRVLKTLRELRLDENTIVVFLTDHGCHFRTRNTEYKRSCHESCTRIPFVIKGGIFECSVVVPELVSIVDLTPTLLDAVGVPIPDEVQGRSLLPLLERKVECWRNEVFVQISEYMLGRAIRTERWKYCIVAPDKKGDRDPNSDFYLEYQLYDLYADPYELVNLAGRAEYRQVASELRERLIRLMTEAGEKKPVIEPAKLYP